MKFSQELLYGGNDIIIITSSYPIFYFFKLDNCDFQVLHGADIEVANRHGHTCLMIACYKGHFNIAKYLLGLKASVNRKSVKGNTALHDCAESGSLDILKLLIENGATMDVDSYGKDTLYMHITSQND